jgi:S-methylmethionine-dependent homocysteine/selenocysteine methylase
MTVRLTDGGLETSLIFYQGIDGYVVGAVMSAEQAAAGVDRVTAMTFTYPDEAIGLADAAGPGGVPSLVSFTVKHPTHFEAAPLGR